MNEQIRSLAQQAFFDETSSQPSDKMYNFSEHKMQAFAELIVQECMELNRKELSFSAYARMADIYAEHFGIDV